MACDTAMQRILDSVDYANGARPTYSELEATCGEEKDWEEWGLEFDYWKEEIKPRFLKEANPNSQFIKVCLCVRVLRFVFACAFRPLSPFALFAALNKTDRRKRNCTAHAALDVP